MLTERLNVLPIFSIISPNVKNNGFTVFNVNSLILSVSLSMVAPGMVLIAVLVF